ncbi:MAG TPA: glycosyltransferase family A protein [Tepidisphaeraceae bacterium]|nr:glycosyltransferase family A protein [Tepidisphaeraceae bacterium]
MRVGLVAIGRNEGARLAACLRAAARDVQSFVYVDSGSTDDSLQIAQSLGAEIVRLDLSIPFTAARSRNAGFARLISLDPSIELVQFIDGDCELVEGWIPTAAQFLAATPKAAVVCGRRRERFPDASRYNAMCDLEWNTPIGRAKSCGGDALMRVTAFQQAGGYNDAVIAGEEPELCVRLRKAGFEIHRIDAEMTLHDAAMTRFGQWWKRNVRAGHAYAEGFDMHGAPPENFRRKEVVSNYVWATPVMWLLWPLLWIKIYRGRRNGLYATFVTLSKLPQAIGQLTFLWNRLRGKRTMLIEYKNPIPAPGALGER